jgi:GPH family glycoside/pentoside/hexuronide:cation symporter
LKETTEKKKLSLKSLFSKDAAEGYIPNNELFKFSLGAAGQATNSNFIAAWIFYFCSDILKIVPKSVGFITGFIRIWDAFNDPMVGSILDSRRCKSGNKFHDYFKWLPIPVGLTSFIMFCKFPTSPAMTIAIVIISYVIWDSLLSVQEVSIWGTVSLMSPHSVERSRATQWTSIGINGGVALASTVSTFLGIGAYYNISEAKMFLIFALVFCIGGQMLSYFSLSAKERIVSDTKPHHSFFKTVASIKENKILLLLCLAQILGSVTISLPAIYFFKYMVSYKFGSFELNGQLSLSIYNLLIYIPGTLGIFFANKFAKKVGGMRNIIILAQSLTVVLRIISYFIGYETLPQMAIVVILMSIASIPAMMVSIAIKSLCCDSIDYLEWKTGKRIEGLTFSIQSLVVKATGAIGNVISGFVLDLLCYDSSITDISGQSATFYRWQWPLFILGPAIGALLYLIPVMMIHYPKEKREMVEKELSERRAAEKSKANELLHLEDV